jgi:hypothetical protein
MTKTTLGILAGIVGSAIGATIWWSLRRPRTVAYDITRFREVEDMTEYSRLAEGIV